MLIEILKRAKKTSNRRFQLLELFVRHLLNTDLMNIEQLAVLVSDSDIPIHSYRKVSEYQNWMTYGIINLRITFE